MRLVTTLAVLLATAAGSAAPPPTESRPVTEEIHGVSMVDPYRWLEGDNSDPAQMGRVTDEVAAWTDAQNAYTRSVLDTLPGRAALEARIRELMEVGFIGSPAMRGNRYFYSKRSGKQAQPVVYWREGHDGEPRVLLDPAAIDPSGLTTVSWYQPNHQGTLAAFGLYAAGDENSTLYVMDVETGEWLADEIPGKVGLVGWLPDSTGFFYRRLEDVKDPYSGQVRFHVLGTHHRQDKVLFSQRDVGWFYEGMGYGQDRLKAISTTWGPSASIDRGARWMVISYWTGTASNDLWVADLDLWFRTGQVVRRPIIVGEQAVSGGPIVGDTLYMRTNLDAPRGRIVAVDLHNPSRGAWREVIPEREDATLQGAGAARGLLCAQYLVNAATRIDLFAMDGTPRGSVELPGIGSASLSVEEDRTEAFLSFSSYSVPASIYRVDLALADRALWERVDVPVDPSIVEVKQVWYSSRDGTRVSMFIIAPRGVRLDGNNPTILYGYGGFNIPMTPGFSATMFPWYEAGGVYAVANLRGGGEYGKSWHESGMLDRKQNVFDDFIAAAEWLIDSGYTRPERLGIAGGSNGGLLTGAAVTQHPDLFAAAISAVPLLDMLRYEQFLMARYWVPEYGSAADAGQFEFLRRYSPYHNVRTGVRYPATLVTAGENDARVHPMHARKMAALLQSATTGSPGEDPILLWVDRDAGHGAGKPLDLQVRDVTDQRIFMMWQLGVLGR